MEPLVIDGYMEMPGRGLAPGRLGQGIKRVHTGYGGGTTTLVGPGTVATPGAWAAIGEAWARYGQVSWYEVMASAVTAGAGCPLPAASYTYLEHTHQLIFGQDPVSYEALHSGDRLLQPGERVVVAGLQESMRRLADQGPGDIYNGQLAEQISSDLLARGGILTPQDLAEYRVEFRTPHGFVSRGWQLVTNPAPAVGGIALSAMLDLATRSEQPSVAELVDIQTQVWDFRRRHVDGDGVDRPKALAQLARDGAGSRYSPSTVHVSAVDSSGIGCAITASAGYGSGIIPAGTGLWMNNGLGEIELVGRIGEGGIQPGDRLLSNMAPTLLLGSSGEVIAAGSPGADRITSALFTVLGEIIVHRTGLSEAIEYPRAHVEWTAEGPRLAHEPGLDLTGVTLPKRGFESPHMFFGGVGVAAKHADGRLEAVADPRRAGHALVISEKSKE